MRIAALDDDKEWIETEREITVEHFQEEKYKFRGYLSAKELLSDIEEEEFDIFLLDMELPDGNGLETARAVKRKQEKAVIIFVTNYVEYAVEAFEVNAFRYIPKKLLKEKLPEAYEAVRKRIEQRTESYFIIQTETRLEKIPKDQIYYMTKEKKYVNIIHKAGQSRIRASLDQVQKSLDSDCFLRIDKGCVVNIEHVMSLEKYQVRMRNGIELTVSHPQLKNVKIKIAEYWSRVC